MVGKKFYDYTKASPKRKEKREVSAVKLQVHLECNYGNLLTDH